MEALKHRLMSAPTVAFTRMLHSGVTIDFESKGAFWQKILRTMMNWKGTPWWIERS